VIWHWVAHVLLASIAGAAWFSAWRNSQKLVETSWQEQWRAVHNGTSDALLCAIRESLPVGIDLEYRHERSPDVPPGVLRVHSVCHGADEDQIPW